MSGRVKFTQTMIDQLTYGWEVGDSAEMIAERLGVSRDVVFRRVHKYGLESRNLRGWVKGRKRPGQKYIGTADNILIEEMYMLMRERDITYRSLSAMSGVSVPALVSWKKRAEPSLSMFNKAVAPLGLRLALVRIRDAE